MIPTLTNVQVLSRFDADHSGDLSFEEYLALMAVWVEEDETQIIEAFKVVKYYSFTKLVT